MKKNKAAGFLLIEVLLAASLLSFGLVVLIQAMASSFRQTESYSNLWLATQIGTQELWHTMSEHQGDEFANLTLTSKNEASGINNVDKIRITIAWNEQGAEKKLELETLSARP